MMVDVVAGTRFVSANSCVASVCVVPAGVTLDVTRAISGGRDSSSVMRHLRLVVEGGGVCPGWWLLPPTPISAPAGTDVGRQRTAPAPTGELPTARTGP